MGLWKTIERGKKDKKIQIKCSTDQSDIISQFGLSVAIKKTKNSGCLSVISSNCDWGNLLQKDKNPHI